MQSIILESLQPEALDHDDITTKRGKLTIIFTITMVVAIVFLLGMTIAACSKNPILLTSVLFFFVLSLWGRKFENPIVNIMGINVFPTDVVWLLMIGIFLVHSLYRNKSFRGKVIFMVISILLTISLLRGVIAYDFGTAFNEGRGYLGFFCGLLWGWTISTGSRLGFSITKASTLGGLALTAVGFMHWAQHGLGSADQIIEGLDITNRILVSGQALVLSVCIIYHFSLWLKNRRYLHLSLTILFSIIFILSQQRTVWFALIAALPFLIFVGENRSNIRAIAAFSLGGAIAFIAGILGVFNFAAGSIEDSVASSGTYEARVRGWNILVNESIERGPLSVLFGQAMGSGFARVEGNGLLVTYAPHNWYVSLYLRIGLIGLAGFVILMFWMLWRAINVRSRFWSSLIIIIGVYAWGYSIPWYIAPLLGAGMTILLIRPKNIDNESPHKLLMGRTEATDAQQT